MDVDAVSSTADNSLLYSSSSGLFIIAVLLAIFVCRIKF
jgi:hypothetical protein